MSVYEKEYEKTIFVIKEIPLFFLILNDKISFLNFPVLFSENFNSDIQINFVVRTKEIKNNFYSEEIFKKMPFLKSEIKLYKSDMNITKENIKDINIFDEDIIFSIEEDISGYDFGEINISVESEKNVIIEFKYLEVKII